MASSPITERLRQGGPSFSFEFFPPKTDEGEQNLWTAIRELEELEPTYVSVTCRASGSTHDATVDLVSKIREHTTLTPMAHLTCAGVSTDTVRETVRRLGDAGIGHILALRGDPPEGLDAEWKAHEHGLSHADELVKVIHEEGDFTVGVAAFAETHPESPDRTTDAHYLARKCAAGADFAVTQFFFETSDYFDLVEATRAAGCDTPIIPGVIPITDAAQIEKFAALSGAALPDDLVTRLRAVADDPEAVRAVGVETAAKLCRELLDGGAPGFHFYCLNRSLAVREVYRALGLLGD
jgi:methylenetetrahydrofolate reductase (NADPH)